MDVKQCVNVDMWQQEKIKQIKNTDSDWGRVCSFVWDGQCE